MREFHAGEKSLRPAVSNTTAINYALGAERFTGQELLCVV